MKLGRNDLCPCGSGKKFKKCHLAAPPTLFLPLSVMQRSPLPPNIFQKAQDIFDGKRKQEEDRINKFGRIRPIMHIPDFHGYMLVTVRNVFYQMPTRSTFTNFLFNYGLHRLGAKWVEDQNALPIDQKHPLFAQHCRARQFLNKQSVGAEDIISVTPNGSASFCEHFYYDLFTVDDNSCLDDELLTRLRDPDQFQGAMHEVFVGATCLRAGFFIARENGPNPNRKHVDFIAAHQDTNQHLLIEAKSRHRTGVLGMGGKREELADLRFGSLIGQASTKDPKNPVAIFIDTNLPVELAERFYTPDSHDPVILSKRIANLITKVRNDNGGVDPYNALIFSNHPQHYSDSDSKAPGNHWAAYISDRPVVRVHNGLAIKDLLKALNLYENVPTDFPKSG